MRFNLQAKIMMFKRKDTKIAPRAAEKLSMGRKRDSSDERGLVGYICKFICIIPGCYPQPLRMNKQFTQTSLKSLDLVQLVAKPGKYTGGILPDTFAFDHMTARHLSHASPSEQQAPAGVFSSSVSLQHFLPKNHICASLLKDQTLRDKIAVIGMACRFPGAANSSEEFWGNLTRNIDAIKEMPTQRRDASSIFRSEAGIPGTTTTNWGGFIEDLNLFEASFFSISLHKAHFIDPQQRLVIELTCEALEYAGINPDTLRSSNSGVFMGINGSDYGQILFHSPDHLSLYAGTGTSSSIAANRVSNFSGLHSRARRIEGASVRFFGCAAGSPAI